MSEGKVKEDPVKMHKDANALMETGKYEEAMEIFLKTADLYKKVQNFFDAATMYYKAGECGYALKDYEKAIEHFAKSAELSFQKGFDRYGVSALEYSRDCHKALGNKKEVRRLEKKIKDVKKKLENSF
jgi:tetratricopeptide (TPR) repeat protein